MAHVTVPGHLPSTERVKTAITMWEGFLSPPGFGETLIGTIHSDSEHAHRIHVIPATLTIDNVYDILHDLIDAAELNGVTEVDKPTIGVFVSIDSLVHDANSNATETGRVIMLVLTGGLYHNYVHLPGKQGRWIDDAPHQDINTKMERLLNLIS
jgi:hypothetical protein